MCVTFLLKLHQAPPVRLRAWLVSVNVTATKGFPGRAAACDRRAPQGYDPGLALGAALTQQH